MPSREVAETEEAPADGGIPVDPPGPYTGVEPDPTTGGFFWYNDPLYPGNDVEPNAEWAEATLTPAEPAPEEEMADS